LGWLPKDLSHFDLPFSEEEIQKVIMEAPKEKAPDLDGFIVLFFSSYWGIIKQDIIRVVHQFCCLNQQELNFLNQSLVVLIPKKEEPKFVSDFRPISLTHSFAKIITNLLANRLARQLNDLISINQTAFIKKKCIHDNFIYVQEVIKDLHKKKVPSLLIKLDISKAFAIVNWSYLLQVMEHLGFTQKWRNWISSLWCTTSSAFLVNDIPCKNIFHFRRVMQEDPLSHILFLLAMEPLHRLFRKAQDVGLVNGLSMGCDTFRVSLYANDAAIFLNIFGEASGLFTNTRKTECYPIQCEDLDLFFLHDSNIILSHFPCTYLGLPLHFKNQQEVCYIQ
jgi:hypothetical protein